MGLALPVFHCTPLQTEGDASSTHSLPALLSISRSYQAHSLKATFLRDRQVLPTRLPLYQVHQKTTVM